MGSIEINTATDESLVPFLTEPPDAGPKIPLTNLAHSGHIGLGMMLRIVDLDKALVFRPARGARGNLTLQLTDPDLPGNEAPRTLSFDGKRSRIEQGKQAKPRLRAGIDVFSQIWFGAVSAVHARNIGAIECDPASAQLLDQAWYGPAPHLGLLNGF
jgi:predicted acetyltransferase